MMRNITSHIAENDSNLSIVSTLNRTERNRTSVNEMINIFELDYFDVLGGWEVLKVLEALELLRVL